LSIEPQAMYSQRGYSPKDNDGTYVNSTLGYLSMPLFLKVNLGEKFAIMAGPQFDFLSSVKDDNNNFDTGDFKSSSTGRTAGLHRAGRAADRPAAPRHAQSADGVAADSVFKQSPAAWRRAVSLCE